MKLACVNWYGAHMEGHVVNGLDKRSIEGIATTIASLGFNCVRQTNSLEVRDSGAPSCLYGTNIRPRVDQSDVRLPLSLEQFYHNPIVETSRLTANPELQGQTSLEQDHNLSQLEHSITMGLDQ